MTDYLSDQPRPQLQAWTLGECWIELQDICAEYCREAPESPTVRVATLISERLLLDDGLDLVDEIVRTFDLQSGGHELEEICGYGIDGDDFQRNEKRLEELTFAELTEFIHQRIPKFQAVTVAGHECESAGVFLSFRPIVNLILRDERRFAPSTPIREVLRGHHLRRFWERLRFWTDNELQPLPQNWYTAFTSLWIAFIGVPVLMLTNDVSPFWLLGLLVVEWLTRAWLLETMDRTLDPLPASIQTFRDLAEYLKPAV